MQDAAAGDDAAADAGAEGEQDQVFDVAAGAHPLFALGGGVGVVFEDDGSFEALGEFVADGVLVEAEQVVGADDDAAVEVDEAGDADADSGEVLVAVDGA